MKENDGRDYLTISELAKLNNVSTDTLRYYDRIGLFKPDNVGESNGYRYYSYAQCEKISTILELKKLGIPLNEIADYIEKRDVNSSLELLEEMEQNLEGRIKELERTRYQINGKIESMKRARQVCPGEIKLEYLKARNVITEGEYISLFDDGLFMQMKLEAMLDNRMSMFASNKVGALVDPESLFDENTKKLRRCAMILIDGDEKDIPDGVDPAFVKEVHEGWYLCANGRGLFRYLSDVAEELRHFVRENNLTVSGDILEQDLIDISVTNDMDEIIYRIEVPVEIHRQR